MKRSSLKAAPLASEPPAGSPGRATRETGNQGWSRVSGVWSVFLALTIGLAVALALAETVVRIASRVFHRPPLVVSHPVMGWAGRPNLKRLAKTYSGGTFRMSTDGGGHRLAYPSERQPARDAPVILLVGDSFVQGIGVEDEETLAWNLAAALPARHLVNLGVAGYGTDQELLSVEGYFGTQSTAASEIVVVAFENDLRDVQMSFDYALARSKPAFRLDGGAIERVAYRPSALDRLMDESNLAWLMRTSLMYRFRPPEVSADSGVGMVVACLQEIQRIGSSHGAPVRVFAHRQLGAPYGQISEVSDRVWDEFIRKTGARDITDALRTGPGPTPIGFDGLHWSAEGARRAAGAMLTDLSSSPLE